MTGYLFDEGALERASRGPSYAGVLDPSFYGHTDDNPMVDDPDQGDYATLFEHLLPKPAKYPKSPSYGSVLRSAARASKPYQILPDRGEPVETQLLPDRGEPAEWQTMDLRGPSRADLNHYRENLYNAVNAGRMSPSRADSLLQQAASAASAPPKFGASLGETAQSVASQTNATIDNLLRGQPRATPAAPSGPVIPRTAQEAYQQAQQRGTAEAQVREQRLADLKQRIAASREQRMADLRSRMAAQSSMTDPTKVGEGVSDLETWARQEAQRLGIDPEVAVRVANTEGGFADPARQNMEGAPAYGPYQLYVGGPSKPGLGDEALQRGIDPRKPEHARAAVTFALEHAAKKGWGAFQGAAAKGIGDFEGIGAQVAANTTPKQQKQAVAAGQTVWEAGKLTPNQLTEGMAQGLDRETALAVCGPAAAIAFARKTGRNPTLPEALNLAKQVGWTLANGMAGPASQLKLLQNMGIPATLEEGAPNAQKVASSVQAGNPVTVSTPGHYFVAEQYDPQTGKFDFGESARVLKSSKGNSWFTLDEVTKLGMGAPRAALYMAAR